MHTESIPVRVPQTGQTMEVGVFDKRDDHISVVLGEGIRQHRGLAVCGTGKIRPRRRRCR